VYSSAVQFLAPFVSNEGLGRYWLHHRAFEPQDGGDFLMEAERNLRLSLDWRHGRDSAAESFWKAIDSDDAVLVKVLDFALKNLRFGYSGGAAHQASAELRRALTEAGSVWAVAGDTQNGYRLQRRVTEVGEAIAQRVRSGAGNAAAELRAAYAKAYGRDPDATAAYAHAVKAVEAAAIPVISPHHSSATLGTLIGDLRSNRQRFSMVMARNARKLGDEQVQLEPVDVLVAEMDLLWHNHTDRHARGDGEPATPVTQPQAEWAVTTAAGLVQTFLSGWISRLG
jgi:hypothetical protein